MPSRQDMKFKTAMEKELKIEVPQGYEIDRQKSTFEKIVFKKIPEKPITWEDYCSLMKGKTVHYTNCNYITISGFSDAYNKFATKKRAEQFMALGKLLQLRDYWVKYHKFEDASGIVVCNIGEIIATCKCNMDDYALSFPTQEMANKFIVCFRDLIKKAYPLV